MRSLSLMYAEGASFECISKLRAVFQPLLKRCLLIHFHMSFRFYCLEMPFIEAFCVQL